MVFYPLLTQTSAVFVQMNQHRNIKKMLRWKLLRSRAARRFLAITPSTHLCPTASFYFLIRVFPFLTDSTESGNVGKMRRMRNCEWKMGMKEETCWGSTGSYSGLYGIFQTMSFLVVKGDFEKSHHRSIQQQLRKRMQLMHHSQESRGRKKDIFEGQWYYNNKKTTKNSLHTHTQKLHYPNINSKTHVFLSLLHLTLSLTHLANISWSPVSK